MTEPACRRPAVALDALTGLARALGGGDQPAATFGMLDRLLSDAVGHRLFTVLLHRPDVRAADRLYSSRPDIYPASGRKSLDEAPTMNRVLTSGVPYLGRHREDIERDFPDHAKIFALECGSIINMPVRWNGAVLGQVNLLHESGHLREDHLPVVEALAHMVVPAFLEAFATQAEECR
jgi:hypothetical protein